MSDGYVRVHRPSHPSADRRGIMKEHVFMVETVLGKTLPEGAEVHHINGIKTDNRNNNFVVCQDSLYHRLLHRRQRALAECGHAGWRRCHCCKKYSPESEVTIIGTHSYHAECSRVRTRNHYYKQRGLPVPEAKQGEQTHCKRGHLLDGQNMYRTRAGFRQCRACENLRYRLRKNKSDVQEQRDAAYGDTGVPTVDPRD